MHNSRSYHTLHVLFYFTLLLISCSCKGYTTDISFTAKKGVLDLRSCDITTHDPLTLQGEWEIYLNKLLTPDFFVNNRNPAPDGTINIYQKWSRMTIDNKRLPEYGHVTYRLRILLPPGNEQLVIHIGRIMTSFRLWNNGTLIAGAGVPGTSRATTLPKIKPQTVSLTPANDSLELILQVANYHFDFGGITGFDSFGTLTIGRASTLYHHHERHLLSGVFICGAFLVMALYHFALFLFGKYEKSLLYLGSICLLMVLFQSREYLLSYYVPDLSWDIYCRLLNIPVFLLCGFFLLFFNALYPEETNKRIVTALTIGSAMYTAAEMIVPQQISSLIYSWFVPYMAILVVFMIYTIIRAALHHRTSAKYIIFGSWTVAFSALNDVLNGFGVINTGFFIPTGGFIFILLCEFGIYERFVQAESIAKRQQEKLIETDKLASIGTLVAGVAHEINNPNNSILLTAQGQSDVWKHIASHFDEFAEVNNGIRIGGYTWDQLRTEMPESIERIVRNSRRIERIVTDLKTYVRKDIAHIMEPLDINTVIRSSITLLENKIKMCTDAFSVSYAETIPLIRGNFQKMEQVIINLMVNSCEAITQRTQALRVGTAYDSHRQRVTITVSDEGCGIEPRILRQIYNPFFSTKHNSGGTGLGLSISQSIITGHNGELSITSEPGLGTRATIDLPTMEVNDRGNTM